MRELALSVLVVATHDSGRAVSAPVVNGLEAEETNAGFKCVPGREGTSN